MPARRHFVKPKIDADRIDPEPLRKLLAEVIAQRMLTAYRKNHAK
jgi:hypothetical protein